MQKYGSKSISIESKAEHETKEASKGRNPDKTFEYAFEGRPKEIIMTCRVDTEGASSEKSSPLLITKDLSYLKEGKSVEDSVHKVATSSNLESILLEVALISFSRKNNY